MRSVIACMVMLAGWCGVQACVAATVALDVGHSRMRPGATSAAGIGEYEYNEAMAGAVEKALVAAGHVVRRIGGASKEVPLAHRGIEAGGADLLVSIHHDSIQQSWVDAGWSDRVAGFAVFVSSLNAMPRESSFCASQVGRMLVQVGEKPSLYHATEVKGENRPVIDRENGVHRFDELIVLKSARVPAILVEVGVIVNPSEERRLAEAGTRQRLALAIGAGIHRCVGGGSGSRER